jgi:ATP-grasp ribosomal peptide maturase
VTVLVLTEPFDTTTDLVMGVFNRRGVPVHRIDTGDFPQFLTVAATIGGHGTGWTGVLSDVAHRTDLTDVSAVYYRRPGLFRFRQMQPMERRWADIEARLGFGGLLSALPCRWVNHPAANASAEYKPRQLALAAQLGLTVPATLITNDPQAARTFGADAPAGLIYKPLHAQPYVDQSTGATMGLTTTAVSVEDITDAVAGTAHLFQHRVLKDHELRVTIVGTRLFAARIDTHSQAARLDWRTDYDHLTYRAVDLPAGIAGKLLALTSGLNLVFAAIDLIVTPQGETVFLEVNPNGEWGWIAEATGLPIAEALADHLEPR